MEMDTFVCVDLFSSLLFSSLLFSSLLFSSLLFSIFSSLLFSIFSSLLDLLFSIFSSRSSLLFSIFSSHLIFISLDLESQMIANTKTLTVRNVTNRPWTFQGHKHLCCQDSPLRQLQSHKQKHRRCCRRRFLHLQHPHLRRSQLRHAHLCL